MAWYDSFYQIYHQLVLSFHFVKDNTDKIFKKKGEKYLHSLRKGILNRQNSFAELNRHLKEDYQG